MFLGAPSLLGLAPEPNRARGGRLMAMKAASDDSSRREDGKTKGSVLRSENPRDPRLPLSTEISGIQRWDDGSKRRGAHPGSKDSGIDLFPPVTAKT